MTSIATAADITPDTRTLIFATAGHVDHGKTSLVHRLTGTDTDTLKEEKQRGLTINLGFAYAHYPDENLTLGFVDVPGHSDFINNMLAGVSAIDAALLIVAADDGIMPQTREHLAILGLMNVEQLIVVISKSDSAPPERIARLQREIAELLESNQLSASATVATSIVEGTGIDQLTQEVIALAANLPQQRSDTSQQFRFKVDRSFSLKGIGTVVTGTCIAGSCDTESETVLSSDGRRVRMRSIRLDQRTLPRLHSGQRAAINIAGLSADEIQRGDFLLAPDLLHPVHRIDVSLQWLDGFAAKSGIRYHLHIGAAHHLVSVRRLSDKYDFYQLVCQDAMHCNLGDRFVLRDPSGQSTLGGGVVLDSFVPRRQRGSEERLSHLQGLHRFDGTSLAELLENANFGLQLEPFQVNANLSNSTLEELLHSTRSSGTEFFRITSSDGDKYVFARSHFERLTRTLIDTLNYYHSDHPEKNGLAEPALCQTVSFPSRYSLFQGITNKLVEVNLLARTASLLHLPTHSPKQSQEEKSFFSLIRPQLLKAGKVPPRTRELAEATAIPLQKLESILKHCVQSGLIIRVANNRHYLPETIVELAALAETLADASDVGFTVIEFRDRSQIGRNLCIEVLEYFDARGFTLRDENTRTIRTQKENIFS